MTHTPKIAIIDSNTLAAIGLRQLLQGASPRLTVDAFGSFSELEANEPDSYVHYFVATDIVLAHRDFFSERQRKTIVLTLSLTATAQLTGFHSICINQPEAALVRQLLLLSQHAHSGGRNLPPGPPPAAQATLSRREIEVMTLVVKGYINKEIADRLHIGLATVVTHRRNMMEKLGVRSVSALTVYAVMNGYVDINKIFPTTSPKKYPPAH